MGRGTVRVPKGIGTCAVGSRYQETASERQQTEKTYYILYLFVERVEQ
jgi:hypothetical protein